MNREQLLENLKSPELPEGEYCLFGGVCLAIRGIRPTNDIDMYVTPELYEKLKNQGWKVAQGKDKNPHLYTEINGIEFEAFSKPKTSEGWQPDIPRYLAQPEIIEGYPFMPLDDMYEWKNSVRRPKDVRDIKLIDEYRAGQRP